MLELDLTPILKQIKGNECDEPTYYGNNETFEALKIAEKIGDDFNKENPENFNFFYFCDKLMGCDITSILNNLFEMYNLDSSDEYDLWSTLDAYNMVFEFPELLYNYSRSQGYNEEEILTDVVKKYTELVNSRCDTVCNGYGIENPISLKEKGSKQFIKQKQTQN